MRKILISLIIVILIGGLLVIYKPTKQFPKESLNPCWWVYKTRADYSDLYSIEPADPEFKILGSIHGMGGFQKLAQFYTGYFYGCYFPHYFSFVNLSISEVKKAEEELKNKTEECKKPIEEYKRNIALEKCPKFHFLKIEKPPIGIIEGQPLEEWIGRLYALHETGVCTIDLNTEELNEFKEIEKNTQLCITSLPQPKILENLADKNYLLDNIVDKDPFVEFYLCDVESISQLNETINKNQLNIECKKKK